MILILDKNSRSRELSFLFFHWCSSECRSITSEAIYFEGTVLSGLVLLIRRGGYINYSTPG